MAATEQRATAEAQRPGVIDISSEDDPNPFFVNDEEPEKVKSDEEIDREQTAGDVETEEGEDQPKRTLSAEEKLKRSRAEAKRLRREQAETRASVERLERQLADLAAAQVQQTQVQLEEQARAVQAEYAAAREARKAAREAGDTAAEDQADERIYRARKAWEGLEAVAQQRKAAPAVRQQTQTAAPASWVTDWQAEHDWFGEDPIDTEVAHAVSRALVKQGIPPNDTRHRERLDEELAKRLPHRYGGRTRPRATGSPVAGVMRNGGAVKGGVSRLPAQMEAIYRAQGKPVDDPKWVAEKLRQTDPATGRTYADSWAAAFGGRR